MVLKIEVKGIKGLAKQLTKQADKIIENKIKELEKKAAFDAHYRNEQMKRDALLLDRIREKTHPTSHSTHGIVNRPAQLIPTEPTANSTNSTEDMHIYPEKKDNE